MCKTYNLIGSLTEIKSHLLRHNIKEFNSLNEVINFQKNYFASRQKIISNHKIFIEKERKILSIEISNLENRIKTNKIEIKNEMRLEIKKLNQQLNNMEIYSTSINKKLFNYFKMYLIKNKIRSKELNFDYIVSHSVRDLASMLTEKNNRYQYIDSRIMDAVYESSFTELKDIENKKSIIDEINTYIYGALGEQKVVRELENLPDEYFLINDFNFKFFTPIFNRQENEYIKSIQIDHLLISPSGIFLIETKNWSNQSLSNLSLRSPVQQIKRSNLALFVLSSEGINNGYLNIDKHHWGERKIPIRNIIVLTNVKPNEEFQYVKILTPKELLGYVKYFKPVFSKEETQAIANYLLKHSGNDD